MENEKKSKASFLKSNIFIMLIVLVAVIVFFTIMKQEYFTIRNFTNILQAASTIGLLAIGETYLIIAGHIDLSCANIASLFAVIAAMMITSGIPWGLVMIIVLVCSILAGLANACLVNVFRLQPFIATLAMSNVFSGMAYLLCDGKPIAIAEKGFNAMGSIRIAEIPLPAILMVACFIVFGIILARTVFGRSVYIIGGNPEAARLAGINPKKVSTILYILCAVISAFAGLLMATKMHSGQPAGGQGSEFDGITASILGGVAFTGGTGNLLGCFVGLMVMQCFNNGLTIIQVSSFWQTVCKGLLLVAALLIDYFRSRNVGKVNYKRRAKAAAAA